MHRLAMPRFRPRSPSALMRVTTRRAPEAAIGYRAGVCRGDRAAVAEGGFQQRNLRRIGAGRKFVYGELRAFHGQTDDLAREGSAFRRFLRARERFGGEGVLDMPGELIFLR